MQKIHYESIYNVELNHWWYKVRRKLIHDFFNKYMTNKPLSILDVGCGAGALMKELETYGSVNGVDFSETAVSFCKSRGINSVQISGIESLPFQDSSFDVVLALDVLEHIPDDKKGVREAVRVLKPGGILILFVPAFTFLWGITDVRSQHYRRYNLKQLTDATEGHLEILKRSYFNTFLFFPIATVRLLASVFKLDIKDENSMSDGFINNVFYYIFNLERSFLKFMNFPFGVSCCIVAKKRLD